MVLVIMGPTAAGKTSLAISLAKKWGSDIFSADSRQIYHEMSIGVARPTIEELSAVKHHFIDTISVEQPYSAGQYGRDCTLALTDYLKETPLAIVAGGSGLFIKALTEGLDEFPVIPNELRERLNRRFVVEGLVYMLEELKTLDYTTYLTIDTQNHRRVLRALEVCLVSGKPYSSFLRKTGKNSNLQFIKIAVIPPRDSLYDRIEKRCHQMVENGLLEEVESLLPFQHLPACKTVGYSEFFDYFMGKISRQEAIEKFVQHTRNYAKRQITWLRKESDLRIFEGITDQSEIESYLHSTNPLIFN